MTSKQLETERKFDGALSASMRSVLALPEVALVQQVLASTLEAVYCDTDELALAAAGITLGRRTGGSNWRCRWAMTSRGSPRSC